LATSHGPGLSRSPQPSTGCARSRCPHACEAERGVGARLRRAARPTDGCACACAPGTTVRHAHTVTFCLSLSCWAASIATTVEREADAARGASAHLLALSARHTPRRDARLRAVMEYEGHIPWFHDPRAHTFMPRFLGRIAVLAIRYLMCRDEFPATAALLSCEA